ncbi:hypothetical protein [Anaerocolumna aminovalerica]|jgi:hypothetical protein|nr:hypothetical protein [Anaerocolumna aminovalerica]
MNTFTLKKRNLLPLLKRGHCIGGTDADKGMLDRLNSKYNNTEAIRAVKE